MAQPPTSIVVGPPLTDGRATADVRFVLGRALEIAQAHSPDVPFIFVSGTIGE